MNDQTSKLLEQLAAKLGTTVEYLWGILVSQARVNAITDCFLTILIWMAVWGLYRLHLRFIAPIKDNRHGVENLYQQYEEALIIPFMIVFTIVFVCAIVSFFNINNIVNGFFNPEYWALEQLLKQL